VKNGMMHKSKANFFNKAYVCLQLAKDRFSNLKRFNAKLKSNVGLHGTRRGKRKVIQIKTIFSLYKILDQPMQENVRKMSLDIKLVGYREIQCKWISGEHILGNKLNNIFVFYIFCYKSFVNVKFPI